MAFLKNVKIKNNVFYNLDNILNIANITNYDGLQGWEIVNNSIYNISTACFYLGELLSSKILNNTIQTAYEGFTAGYDSGNIIDYNDLNAVVVPYGGLTPGANTFTFDPLFTDPDNGDLTLQAGSPCAGAGIGNDTYSEVPLTDYNGDARPSDTPAIGAFELEAPSPTSKSYFSASSVGDGTNVTSYVNLPVLVTAIQDSSSDTYFDSTSELGKVVIHYLHEDGRQQKKIYHFRGSSDTTTLSAQISWSSFSRDGAWQKVKIRSYDREGAQHILNRSDIGTGEDATHTSGVIYLNTL